MSLVIQKFGGTSVATSKKILAAARRAIRAEKDGQQVVMVVSAMGKNTDMLVELANEINERPPAREMDMLLSTGEQVSVALMAMAIDSLGHQAVSLTGSQIGIKTDSSHTKARIRSISTERIKEILDDGKIVIAAGFQGIDEDLNITTLGRGGSDTTAVALAAVLEADTCEIYTDVDGVYTTDPRAVAEARRVPQISYDEMLELASLGAGVMHSRSIEFAKKFSVPIHVRCSASDAPGTMIVATPEETGRPVCGAALTKDEAIVTVSDIPDVPGTSSEIFSRIARRTITVDMIVQNVGHGGKANISFTVLEAELEVTLDAVQSAVTALGGGSITSNSQVSKVSVVGLGMAKQTGVADQMFRTLAAAEINMHMITTSEIKISALVDRDSATRALRAVHEAFQLDHAAVGGQQAVVKTGPATVGHDAVSVVDHLRAVDMEELVVDGIELDATQSRVTVEAVPDTPGVAAGVFDEIAKAGVFVDMIIQSYGHEGLANLSFTVPRDSLDKSMQIAGRIAKKLNCAGVTNSPEIAKLSVSGIGLRSHTGVAIRMFKALAEANINVEMINTSEMRVNVVVDGTHGEAALEHLKGAFADVLQRVDRSL